jgi:hypothetical protein
MSDTLARSTRQAEYTYNMAPLYGMRTGQLLFSDLRYEVAEIVRGTDLDPFYKDLSLLEIINWFEDHIVFDDQGIICRLFSGDTILWEAGKNG